MMIGAMGDFFNIASDLTCKNLKMRQKYPYCLY